jgi:hypothetical protein
LRCATVILRNCGAPGLERRAMRIRAASVAAVTGALLGALATPCVAGIRAPQARGTSAGSVSASVKQGPPPDPRKPNGRRGCTPRGGADDARRLKTGHAPKPCSPCADTVPTHKTKKKQQRERHDFNQFRSSTQDWWT